MSGGESSNSYTDPSVHNNPLCLSFSLKSVPVPTASILKLEPWVWKLDTIRYITATERSLRSRGLKGKADTRLFTHQNAV